MPDVYSPALAATMALLVGTIVCIISARISASAHLVRLAWIGLSLALLVLVLSVVSHVSLGHAPDSENGLGVIGFITNHPIVPVLLVAAVVLGLLLRRQVRS